METTTTSRKIKTNRFTRLATIENISEPIKRADGDDAGEGDEERIIELSFSSEEPVSRWFGEEILDHSPESVRMDFLKSGNAPFLTDHIPLIKNQIGVVQEASIDPNRVGRAKVRVGRDAFSDEVFQKIQDEISTNISFAYAIHKMVLEESGDDREVYRATDWEPLEISLVTIPADKTVGVGRSDDDEQEYETEIIETKSIEQEEITIMETPEKVELTETEKTEQRKKLLEGEDKRVKDIIALAARHKMSDVGAIHIQKGTSIEVFRGVVLEKIGDETLLDTPASNLGMDDKETKRFSLLRLMRHLAQPNVKEFRDEAGFELECSDEVQKRLNGKSPGGAYIPLDVQMSRGPATSQEVLARAIALGLIQARDLSVGTTTAGGFLKGTDNLGASFIEVLRNAMKVRGMGARVLSGLVGDITIPRQASGASGGWISTEGGNAAESDAVFAQVSLTPKTVGAFTDVTRQLLLQSDPSIDAIVRDDLAFAVALAVDLGAINGSGASGQPTGILNVSGIGDVDHGTNGGAPTWALVVEHITDVEVANALRGALGFLTTAQNWGKMSTTEKASGTAKFLVEEPGTMLAGYPLERSQQVPSNLVKGSSDAVCSANIFGNWNDLLIGEWGIVDLLVDPYTASIAGTVRFVVHQSIDVAVRHAGSFTASQDILTT